MRRCVFVIAKDKSFVLDGKGSGHFETWQNVGGRTFQVVPRTNIDCEWIWRGRVFLCVLLWCVVILTSTTRMPFCRLWTSPWPCLRAVHPSEFGIWWTKNSKQQSRAFWRTSEPKHRFAYHLHYPVWFLHLFLIFKTIFLSTHANSSRLPFSRVSPTRFIDWRSKPERRHLQSRSIRERHVHHFRGHLRPRNAKRGGNSPQRPPRFQTRRSFLFFFP